MIVTLLLNKLKSLAFIFICIFKRALCCIKRRRTSNCDVVPLTHVISNTGDQLTEWEDWNVENLDKEPKTVQVHIDLYRKQKSQFLKQSTELPDPEEQLNLFEDMTPHITRQTKIFVNKDSEVNLRNDTNRLKLMEDNLNITLSAELSEWEDTGGWEGENLENDAQKLLRENKRFEREQRALQQQQKRQEKMLSRSLGSKVTI